MRPATSFALRFAVAAAAVVALGTLASELLPKSSDDPFGPPTFGVATAVFSIGTFMWSYITSAGTASAMQGIDRVPRIHAIGAGIAFALLTPALGYILSSRGFGVFFTVLAVWVLAYPVLITVALARIARPSIALQADRER
jgi:hypothetical protein